MGVCIPYTEEQIKWLKDNEENYEKVAQLTKVFNKRFNCNRTEAAIRTKISNLGLKLRKDLYTPEQNKWLADNVDIFAYPILAEKFTEKFGKKVSPGAIKYHCLRTIRKSNPHPCKESPIGHEFKNENGITFIKVRNINEFDGVLVGDKKRVRKLCYETKQRFIWKQHNGNIPDDCQIIFLNSDREDFRIENLYCIKKKYLPYMRHNNWFSTNPEVTLTAIKWCELMYATQK